MRLRTKLGRRLLGAMTSTLLMTMLLGAPPAWAAGGLHPTHVLHATAPLVRRPTHVAGTPYRVPLRVRNPPAYAFAKAAAESSYRAWARRHQGRRGAAAAPGAGSGSATVLKSSMAPPTALSVSGSSSPAAPSPGAALFEGLDKPGIVGGEPNTAGTPPDTTGAIGPNAYAELVNSQIAFYERSRLASPAMTEGEDEFTESTDTCDGQIKWDKQGGRWEYASLDCGPGAQGFSFGWSKTANPANLAGGPTGSWCKYHVETGSVIYDYPKLGMDDDYLLIGVNRFNAEKTGEYLGSSLLAIPKPAAGVSVCPPSASVAPKEFAVPVFTPVPASMYGASATGYVVAAEYPETAPGKSLSLFTVTKGTLGPELHESSVSVASFAVPAAVPQPGTTDPLDSSDTRLTQAVAAEDPTVHEMRVWTQHTIANTTTPGEPSVVRWYELGPGSATPVQEGTIAAGEDFAFNGAISPTSEGAGAAIDYNVGGPGLLAELLAQSRGAKTPAGAMEGGVTLATSVAADDDSSCPSAVLEPPKPTACRWGDYAGASPDPLQPRVVWGAGQVNGRQKFANQAQWSTYNFALTADMPPLASFASGAPSPTAGLPVSFDGSGSNDPDGTIVSYEWSFGDNTAGEGEKPVHTYAAAGSYTVKLTVVDDAGLSASVEHTIAVAEPGSASGGGASGGGASGGGGLSTASSGGGSTSSVTTVIERLVVVPLPSPALTMPSNVVIVKAIRLNRASGRATLILLVPGPGALTVRGAVRKHARKRGALTRGLSLRTAHNGTMTVQIVPTAAGRMFLNRAHKLAVKVLIAFTPTGGTQRTFAVTVRLVKRPGRLAHRP